MCVNWRSQAVSHLRAIESYVEPDSPAAARAVEKQIRAAVVAIGTHPHMGRLGRVEGTREFVVAGGPYIVTYAVTEDEVHILAVLHSARRWPQGL